MSSQCRKIYDNISPALLIPDHFLCNQSSTMVAIYNEPLGFENDSVTLMFPGDISGSSPQRVNPRRIGNQTLVFDTPVYSSSRGLVEVLPLLNLANGEVLQLCPFKLPLKHPLTNVMELCMKLSTSNAVLPVLVSLMIHSDKTSGKDHFMDPHTDRMMTLLVGSMKPGTSGSIKDILIPDKKWKKMTLADLARVFGLRNMEKESYLLNVPRKRTTVKRTKTISTYEEDTKDRTLPSDTGYDDGEDSEGLQASFSSPSINTVGLDTAAEEVMPGAVDMVSMTNQMVNDRRRACRVVKEFYCREPSKLTLKVGQRVYVVSKVANESGWWYGACDGKHGYFPSHCVIPLQDTVTEVGNARHSLHTSTPPLMKRKPLPPLPKRQPLPVSYIDKHVSPDSRPTSDRTSGTSPMQMAMQGELLQKQLQQQKFQRRPRDTEHIFQTPQQNASQNPPPATPPLHRAHNFNPPQSDETDSDEYEDVLSIISCSDDDNIDLQKTEKTKHLLAQGDTPRWGTRAVALKSPGNTSRRLPMPPIRTTSKPDESSKPPFSPETLYTRKVQPAQPSKPQPPVRDDSKQSLNQDRPPPPVRQSSLFSSDNAQHVRASERYHLEVVASETSNDESDVALNQDLIEDGNSSDDTPYYVNVDHRDLPVCREVPFIQLKYKGMGEVDVVKGHIYDRPHTQEAPQQLNHEYHPDQQTRYASSMQAERHSPQAGDNQFAHNVSGARTSQQMYPYSESMPDSIKESSVASIVRTMTSSQATQRKASKPLTLPPRDISRVREASRVPRKSHTNFGNSTTSSMTAGSTTVGNPPAQNIKPVRPKGPSVAWQAGRLQSSFNPSQRTSPGVDRLQSPFNPSQRTSPGVDRLQSSFNPSQRTSPGVDRLQSPFNPSQRTSPGVDRRVKFVIERSPESEEYPSSLLNKLM